MPHNDEMTGCASHEAHPAYTKKGFEYNDHNNSSAQFFGAGVSLVHRQRNQAELFFN